LIISRCLYFSIASGSAPFKTATIYTKPHRDHSPEAKTFSVGVKSCGGTQKQIPRAALRNDKQMGLNDKQMGLTKRSTPTENLPTAFSSASEARPFEVNASSRVQFRYGICAPS
jgi:hypothetical protein